jgi:Trk K+ transport system NAD-binding subunit
MEGHVVVCGLDSLGVRLVEELRRLGEEVVVVVDEGTTRVPTAEQLGASIVCGPYRAEETLHQAEVETARAIALLEQDDVGNLHAGLAAQEINAGIRIVMRLFNDPLRRSVEALLPDCVALSASAIAAPLFVSAALGEEDYRRLAIAGRAVAVTSIDEKPGECAVLLPLSATAADGSLVLLPERASSDGLVLLDAAESSEGSSFSQPVRRGFHPREQAQRIFVATAAVADRRFRRLLAAIVVIVAISMAIFSIFGGLNLFDALYFTITTITTTGYGDITVLHSSPPVKAYGIVLMLVGATLLAVFYAILIDAVVGVRLTRALGGVRGSLRDHVIVCGLGNVGLKVVEQLAAQHIPAVAIERDGDSIKIQTARRLGVGVVVSDASAAESLRSARVEQAACLIAVTNDDVTNLEAALNARHVRPELRVVLRLFDHDLATRVQRTFGIAISRSVSALAAPAFAAALLDRRVLTVIPIGHLVLVVADVEIEVRAPLDGKTVGFADRLNAHRVLALKSQDGSTVWLPPTDSPMSAGDRLIVMATRAGLSDLLVQARSG